MIISVNFQNSATRNIQICELSQSRKREKRNRTQSVHRLIGIWGGDAFLINLELNWNFNQMNTFRKIRSENGSSSSGQGGRGPGDHQDREDRGPQSHPRAWSGRQSGPQAEQPGDGRPDHGQEGGRGGGGDGQGRSVSYRLKCCRNIFDKIGPKLVFSRKVNNLHCNLILANYIFLKAQQPFLNRGKRNEEEIKCKISGLYSFCGVV